MKPPESVLKSYTSICQRQEDFLKTDVQSETHILPVLLKFLVLEAVLLRICIFWDMMLYLLLSSSWHFQGTSVFIVKGWEVQKAFTSQMTWIVTCSDFISHLFVRGYFGNLWLCIQLQNFFIFFTAGNYDKASEILSSLEKLVPNMLQVAYRRINLERRCNNMDNVCALYEHYISNTKNKVISNNMAIKYARFCWKVCTLHISIPLKLFVYSAAISCVFFLYAASYFW